MHGRGRVELVSTVVLTLVCPAFTVSFTVITYLQAGMVARHQIELVGALLRVALERLDLGALGAGRGEERES